MIKKLFKILFIMFLVNTCYAVDDKYKICFVNGFFNGSNEDLLAGIATHIQVKKGLLNHPLCSAAHQNAYRVGEMLSHGGKLENQNEEKILSYAMDFKKQVYDFISSNIRF